MEAFKFALSFELKLSRSNHKQYDSRYSAGRCDTKNTAAYRRFIPLLKQRGVTISQRSMSNLLKRYDELLTSDSINRNDVPSDFE